VLIARCFVAAAFVLAVAGCGQSSKQARTNVQPTGRTAAATTGGEVSSVTSGTTTALNAQPTTTKAGYERAMQSRIDLIAPQCYSPDPAEAAKQQLERVRAAIAQLEAIKPPKDAEHAHQELIAVTRVDAEKLAALIKRARADGQVTPNEQSRIQRQQQDLLLKYLPPRSAGAREGAALRELKRKGYDVEPKGPPKPQYIRRVQALVNAAGVPAKSFQTTSSRTDLQSQLRRQRDVAWRVARTLDDITPPTQAFDGQQRLVAALCQRGQLYDGLGQLLALKGTPQNVRGALFNARDADRINSDLYGAAFQAYRSAGYAVRPATGPPG
jgi:hypothetical protein